MSDTPTVPKAPPVPVPETPEAKLVKLQALLMNGKAELEKTIDANEMSALKAEKQLETFKNNIISLKAQRNLLKEILEVLS